MRLLQMMAGARHGGAETFFVDLAAALARRNIEQLALTRPHPDRVAGLESAGIKVETARFGPPFDLLTRFRVARAAGRFSPDVALVWMNRAASFAPRGAHVTIGRLGGYYDLKYYRRCDALICNTVDICDYAIAGGRPRNQVFHIPNFCPVGAEPALDKRTLDTPATALVALVLARLVPSKGVDRAIQAVARLPGVYLWIAGEGPELAHLRQIALSAGIPDRVRFLGWRTDRAALLRAADVCVVASRDEPFGNVVINAWAHGAPLVATRTKGPAALIRDGVDGVLVEPDSVESLAEGLKRVISDVDGSRLRAAAGRARAEAEYSETTIVGRYLEVFKVVAQRSRADLPGAPGGA